MPSLWLTSEGQYGPPYSPKPHWVCYLWRCPFRTCPTWCKSELAGNRTTRFSRSTYPNGACNGSVIYTPSRRVTSPLACMNIVLSTTGVAQWLRHFQLTRSHISFLEFFTTPMLIRRGVALTRWHVPCTEPIMITAILSNLWRFDCQIAKNIYFSLRYRPPSVRDVHCYLPSRKSPDPTDSVLIAVNWIYTL